MSALNAAASRRSDDACAKRLLTADDLAERWQVSKAQVYRLARCGRIPTVPIGRYYRFRPEAIETWECAHEGTADA
jgi:excisionase family DNA binding protein